MKTNEIVKLKTMKTEELNEKLVGLQKQLVDVRLQLKLGREKNLHAKSNISRDIARIKTTIREQELIEKVKTATALPLSKKTAVKKEKN